ncbi:MAG: PAS domain S-box protein, partial [Chloroflexi bacterium]|nr:PAS domain S-box protein [Chloroflexota bacterium]
MKKQNTIDQSLQDLIDIVHFTENVSAKIHGLQTEAEIFKTVIEEFAKSKRYVTSILLLTKDGSGLGINESSVSSRVLNAMAKVAHAKLEAYRIDLHKSVVFSQVVREHKTLEASGDDIMGELFPKALAVLLTRILGVGKQPSILTPLSRHGKVIGVLTVTSTSLAELLIPSVRNLAQHITSALEAAEEHGERLRVEKALQHSEQHFRALIEHAPDMILILNADGAISYASPSIERQHGYASDELVGTPVGDYMHPDDVSRATEAFTQGLRNPAQPITMEVRVRHKDGHWCTVEFTSKNLLDDPIINGIVVNYRDITGRKQAEDLFAVLAANS